MSTTTTTPTPAPRATPEPLPYIMTDPLIELNGHEKHCLASHVELNPDVSTVETPTFCGTKVFPGNVTWHLQITFYQSFDAEGTDENLSAIWDAYQTDGSLCHFVIRPYRNRPVGPRNPEFSGDVTPQPYTLIAGDAGEASTIDIDWILNAPPERSTTATASAPTGGTTATTPAPAAA